MKRFGLLWKCLLLAALDVGTVLLFFSVWDVVRLNIFPVVLLHLLLVLLMVDAAVIALPYARRRVPGLLLRGRGLLHGVNLYLDDTMEIRSLERGPFPGLWGQRPGDDPYQKKTA